MKILKRDAFKSKVTFVKRAVRKSGKTVVPIALYLPYLAMGYKPDSTIFEPTSSSINKDVLFKKGMRVVPLLLTMPMAVTSLAKLYFWHSDLTLSSLQHWQLNRSEFLKLEDIDVHLVQSSSFYRANDPSVPVKSLSINTFDANKAIDKSVKQNGADTNPLNPPLTTSYQSAIGYPVSKTVESSGGIRDKLKESTGKAVKIVQVKPPHAKKVLVLLHGTSASLHTWDGWANALSEEYRVVRMDLPGFGLTGPFKDPNKPYTPENYVKTVIDVMDKLNIEKAIIAGNSMGGGIAWLLALRYPKRVSHLVLIDSMGYTFVPKRVPIGFVIARFAVFDPLVNTVLPRKVIRTSIESVYADPTQVTEDLVQRYRDLTLRAGNRKALGKRLRDFTVMKDIKYIDKIQQPTLIIWGKQDTLIPVKNAHRFHAALPNSDLFIFDHLGHVPHEEDPKITVQAFKQFIKKHETAKAAAAS